MADTAGAVVVALSVAAAWVATVTATAAWDARVIQFSAAVAFLLAGTTLWFEAGVGTDGE